MSAAHVSWLVDRWAASHWVPLANVFSVGDVLIAAGGLVFALVATGAADNLRPRAPRHEPAADGS